MLDLTILNQCFKSLFRLENLFNTSVSPVKIFHIQVFKVYNESAATTSSTSHDFLAHLWGAYAIPYALSGVRRSSYVVCRLCPP